MFTTVSLITLSELGCPNGLAENLLPSAPRIREP
jgi:hypothetical protein